MIDLKLFRKDNGIRQSELCAILGVKQSYISLMESGVRPLNREKFEILKNHYGDIVDAYHEKYKQINNTAVEQRNLTPMAGNLPVDERSILLQLLSEKDRVIELLNEKYNSLAEKHEALLEKNSQLEDKLHSSMAEKFIIKKIEPKDGTAELN